MANKREIVERLQDHPALTEVEKEALRELLIDPQKMSAEEFLEYGSDKYRQIIMEKKK